MQRKGRGLLQDSILTKKHSHQRTSMLQKLHPRASKEAKSSSRAVMPGTNQHLHFSLSHQWLIKWPLVTVVQSLHEDFSPFLCPSPPLPVRLSFSNTCFPPSLSLLSRWPNFPLVLKVTHTHIRLYLKVGVSDANKHKEKINKQSTTFSWFYFCC